MYVEVEPGVRLFVQDVGNGPAVVLLAGMGMDHTTWDRQVRVLSAAHRVVCVDVRGHGFSDKPAHGYDLDRLTRDVAAVLDALALPTYALVGWSFGGQLAFHLATLRPELVSQLILIGSNGVRASRSERFPFGLRPETLEAALVGPEQHDRLCARRRTIVGGFAAPPDDHVVAWLLSSSLRMPSWSALACYATMIHADLLDELDAVRMPVLQIVGDSDPVHSARGARWLQERLADTQLVELPACGHYPMVERPDELDAALLEFLGVRS